MKQIREDSISIALTMVAATIPIYLSTFIGWPVPLQTVSYILIIGLVIQFYMFGKPKHDTSLSPKEITVSIQYTIIALLTFGIAGFFIPELFKPPAIPELSEGPIMQVQGPLLYGILFAISEEQFFRGAWLKFASWKIKKPFVPEFLSGIIFGIYHFAVYGTSSEKIAYVLVAGWILAVCVMRSGRFTPAITAHIINNIMV